MTYLSFDKSATHFVSASWFLSNFVVFSDKSLSNSIFSFLHFSAKFSQTPVKEVVITTNTLRIIGWDEIKVYKRSLIFQGFNRFTEKSPTNIMEITATICAGWEHSILNDSNYKDKIHKLFFLLFFSFVKNVHQWRNELIKWTKIVKRHFTSQSQE